MLNIANLNIDFEGIVNVVKTILFKIVRVVPDFLRGLPIKVRLVLMIIMFIIFFALIYCAYRNRNAWMMVNYN